MRIFFKISIFVFVVNLIFCFAGGRSVIGQVKEKTVPAGFVLIGGREETPDSQETFNSKEGILGEFIGVVGDFQGAEIIVNGRDTIGVQAPIGRGLVVDANGQYVYLQSTFPMQTIVKSKVVSGDRGLIKKGMKVYLKPLQGR